MQEHSFDIDIGGVSFNWLLYDVGGAVRMEVASGLAIANVYACFQRGQRHAWVPYFEDGKWVFEASSTFLSGAT